MTPPPVARWLTAALVAAGCAATPPSAPERSERRLEALSEAVAVQASDPAAAAALFESAGPGAALEVFRYRAWLESLAAVDSPAAGWQRLIEAAPHDQVRTEAWRRLADRLADDGDATALAAHVAAAPPGLGPAADELAVRLRIEPVWRSAAARLAETSPARLRRAAPDLEAAAVAALDPAARLRRALAWAESGAGTSARLELRALEADGPLEAERRRALARLELESGDVTRALRTLPGASRASPEDHLVRAQAYRRRAWSRVPDRRAAAAFGDCLEAAGRAAADLGVDRDAGAEARRTVLECGTEAGALDDALDAWRQLESAGRTGERRDWLGRRLGVALATAGRVEARELAAALPDDRRCLRYWLAIARRDRATLADLAAAPVADVYGVWARRRLGEPSPTGVVLGSETGASAPPAAVRWLAERGLTAAAVDEWRRLAAIRPLGRAEALAAAETAVRHGDRMAAIRFLRQAMPALGGPGIEGEPADAVRAYLPLPYAAEVRAAAAESGLDPWLVAAVARQESTFHPRARSPRNARGLMQLLAGTARGHGVALGLGPTPDLEDPAVNLRLGARELAAQLARWDAVEPALAAYNAGPSRVARWRDRWRDPEELAEQIPIPETYTYVRRVVYLAEAYRLVYAETWREVS